MRVRILVTAVLALALATYLVARPAQGSDKTHFKATLGSYGEVPTNSTTGQGDLDLRIDDSAKTITFTLTYSGLAAPAAAAHIHLGARSTNGGVSVFFCGGGGQGPCPPGRSRGDSRPPRSSRARRRVCGCHPRPSRPCPARRPV